MNIISTFIVWTWLLCIGLVAPTTLPAGGAQESIIQHRENNIESTLIALKDFDLLSSATLNSSILTTVQAGTLTKTEELLEAEESKLKFFNAINGDSILFSLC